MFFNYQPDVTGAVSVLPYNAGLEANYSFMSAFGDPVSMSRHVGDTLQVPRETVPVGVHDVRVKYAPVAIDCKFTPKNEEQQPLAERCIKLLQQGVNHVFDAPTGWGKSVEGGYIAARMGQPTLIVVHKTDLMDSWYDALVNVLKIDPKLVGKVQQDTCDWQGKMFVIAMVHSLVIPDRYPEVMYRYFGMMILDEVHTMAADTFVEVCWKVPAFYRLGFSATPNRSDGKWKIVEAHVGVVHCKGTLVPMTPKILVVKTGWKIPERKTFVDGHWEFKKIPFAPGRMALVTKAMASNNERNLKVVDFTKSAYNASRVPLVLSDSLAHLDRLFQMLTSAGIPGNDIGYYVGGMSKIELEITKKKRVVLATYQMVGTGTNVPHWDSLSLTVPRANIKQIVGRVLRFVQDKKQPVIQDLVDYDKIFNSFFHARLSQYYGINAEVVYM